MNSIFKHRRANSRQELLKHDNSSEDSVDRAIRSDKLHADKVKSGQSTFRNTRGEPMHLQVKQNGSNVSLSSKDLANSSQNLNTNNFHKRSVSEGNTNPDALPRHPEPKQSLDILSRVNLKPRPPKVSVSSPGKSGKEESKIQESGDFESIDLQGKENVKDQIRKRHPNPRTRELKINTSATESNPLNEKSDDYEKSNHNYAATSATSPLIRYKRNTFIQKRDDKPELMQIRNRRKSSSSSGSEETRKLISQSILQNYDQELNHVFNNNSDESQKQVVEEYIKLVKLLKLPKIFYNPELDILNRFCLEYTSLCAHTEPKSMFTFKVEEHYSRVYKYMDKRIDSTSTPIDNESIGVNIPKLITRLFLGDFRITSHSINKIGINVPILSHNHKLSLDRFRAIVINVFHKKKRYYNTIDISRHELSHLA